MRIIAGSARGRRLLSPAGCSTRPALASLRESIFAILAERVEGRGVLDLFAGGGSLGLEALSRGARHAHFVDLDRDCTRVLEKNVWNLGFHGRSTILSGNALTMPDPRTVEEGTFDLVFMDPPFAMLQKPAQAARLFARLEELLESDALGDGAILVLRLPSEYSDPPPRTPRERRRYGESAVLFFQK